MKKYINPRETEEYKKKRSYLSEYSDSHLILAVLYELFRDMKYKNALENPSRTIKPEEYCLMDEMRERLK